MNRIMRTFNAWLGARMSTSGRFVQIETRGRTSGQWRATPLAYVEGEDGTLVVRAGHANADWALNLLAKPTCRAPLRG